mgnify:CR=1 FL=1
MKKKFQRLVILLAASGFVICMTSGLLLLNACTISLQNIETDGTASDLVDENQSASPQVDSKIDANIHGA